MEVNPPSLHPPPAAFPSAARARSNFIDLAQTKQPSTAITGDAYFTSIDWAVAYTYNSSTRAWTRITSSTAANLSNGQGVWVWANKAGTLIP